MSSRALASTATSLDNAGAVPPPTPQALALSPGRALALPLLFTAALAAGAWYPPVRQHPGLFWSHLGPAAILLVWIAALFVVARRAHRLFTLEIVLRPQHYVQACAHASIFLYWGWYWRPVYDAAHLIVAQLFVAYAVDALLGYSRRGAYALGFGPFPIVFSTNLFLWFKADWFYLQVLMIATGFAAKEFIRWTKDGRRTHIFNPSSFTLTLFSLALIATGTSDVTWGQDIAITQFYPPQMYLFLFLVALPGGFLFGVTTMTLAAVATTYLWGLAYYGATGTYYFVDAYIPIAVFLGMHLLFTDPSTAPRTELGRFIFGAMYGLSTVALYGLLGVAGLPTFYDKLLQVPFLNLTIRGIDRAVRSGVLRRFDPGAIAPALARRRRHLAYVAIWTGVFTVMTAAQGVGDHHRGQWLPFWLEACRDNRAFACRYLTQMHTNYCDAGAGWSCNELGVLRRERNGNRAGAIASLTRGCDLGFQPACTNEKALDAGGALTTAPPSLEDLPIVLRGSKGPIADRTPASLYARACDQGWPGACGESP